MPFCRIIRIRQPLHLLQLTSLQHSLLASASWICPTHRRRRRRLIMRWLNHHNISSYYRLNGLRLHRGGVCCHLGLDPARERAGPHAVAARQRAQVLCLDCRRLAPVRGKPSVHCCQRISTPPTSAAKVALRPAEPNSEYAAAAQHEDGKHNHDAEPVLFARPFLAVPCAVVHKVAVFPIPHRAALDVAAGSALRMSRLIAPGPFPWLLATAPSVPLRRSEAVRVNRAAPVCTSAAEARIAVIRAAVALDRASELRQRGQPKVDERDGSRAHGSTCSGRSLVAYSALTLSSCSAADRSQCTARR